MGKWNSVVVSLVCGDYLHYDNSDAKIYRTFGNHDVIIVSSADGNNSNDVLNEMWEKTNRLSISMRPGDSVHNLFGVIKSKEGDTFWEKESAFLFISELQLNYDCSKDPKEQQTLFEEQIRELLNSKKLKEGYDYLIYYSLNCGDYILFFCSNSYNDGSDIIHNITIKLGVKHYNYSVCGIDLKAFFSRNIEEIIPKVVVCSILSDATSYIDWYAIFKEKYPNELIFNNIDSSSNALCGIDEIVHMARLGNEDVCINIYNCNLRRFIENTISNGVFSQQNDLARTAFSKLRIQLDTEFKNLQPVTHFYPINNKTLIEKFSGQWKAKLIKIVNPYIYKAFSEVFLSIENLEKKEFAVDIQDCIKNVFPLFVKKVQQFNELGQAFDSLSHEKYYSIDDFNRDLILFTTGLMSIANGTLHADKLFINVPGFNAVLCDVPAKLLVYYTAYLQKLVNILLDEDATTDYRFLLCPDLYLSIEVAPLFKYRNDDSQLLKVRLPVKKIFDPKTLLMELSHEAAHFVETRIRQRSERVDYFASLVSIIIAERILKPRTLKKEQYENLEFTIISSFLPKGNRCIEEALNNQWKAIVEIIRSGLLKGIDRDNKDSLYLSNLTSVGAENIIDIIIEAIPDLKINSISEQICRIILEQNDANVKYEYVNVAYLSEIIRRHIYNLILCDGRTLIDLCSKLLSESFADLILLYITQDPTTYLNNIYHSLTSKKAKVNNRSDNIWNEPRLGNMDPERIISVLTALDIDINSFDVSDSDNADYSDFIEALKFYADRDNYADRAYPYSVIDITAIYLKQCLMLLREKEKDIDYLRQFYRIVTTSKNVEDCMNLFQNFAIDFRRKINEL